MFKESFSEAKCYFTQWQRSICGVLSEIDGSTKFNIDNWTSNLGCGETRVVDKSKVFESAGVNFSHVSADKLPEPALPGRGELAGKPYEVIGVSTVIHPYNPYIPTTHANLRLFVVDPDGANPYWWFGGGFDLTPYYGFAADCKLWHKYAYNACAPFGDDVYEKFKSQCDDYFYMPHRKEHRGIGGLFFDNLNSWGFDDSFSFVKNVGSAFTTAYSDIVASRMAVAYGQRERDFQAYRRGRYVEFNLLYDRGTKFGIESGGRTESILMSLPANVNWRYNWKPDPGSKEAELYEKYLVKTDWLKSILV